MRNRYIVSVATATPVLVAVKDELSFTHAIQFVSPAAVEYRNEAKCPLGVSVVSGAALCRPIQIRCDEMSLYVLPRWTMTTPQRRRRMLLVMPCTVAAFPLTDDVLFRIQRPSVSVS